ncbi:MAG: RnfABCDGE type electron transport complex subunit D [Rhodocyclaceae bacterium]|nr:RnfABCDGE type electron transport complex subunit D [Rhodocyclaceae bacterium]MBX3668901.1 RnfABCDGE type electron transport complex subunit D [Rhodocyclaceae bacterium]
MNNSPFILAPASVTAVMLKVLGALLPGVVVYAWIFGPGVLVQIVLASLTALAAEAAMLAARGRPAGRFLADGSALVTAWLIALTFPPIAPWWITVGGTAFAIVVAKHLYGGLGQNPFNPAMVGFAVMIVAFPALMSQWPAQGLSAAEQIGLIFGAPRPLDAITAATALDALRTGLHESASAASVATVMASHPAFGQFAGRGWEWIALAYLAGGLYLLQQRLITWHIPVALLLGLGLTALPFWLADTAHYASPLFHLTAGASVLGAFFIATDPVSGATTPRGKLIYAAGIGVITWFVRAYGAYPDGIAFATLLMNICVPLIDMKTQPPVFGRKERR